MDEPKCFVPGECQGSVDHIEQSQSQEACLALCQEREGCTWFTFYAPTSGKKLGVLTVLTVIYN